jgi:hypothetical protein
VDSLIGVASGGTVWSMPTRRPIPPALKTAPFDLARAEALGVSRSQLRGARFSRPFRGIHLVGTVAGLYELCEAARLVLPPCAVFSDETAAALLGLPLPRTPRVLHVTLPPGFAAVRRAGMVGHVRAMLPEDISEFGALRMTTAARTFVDLAARNPRQALVALGDAILRERLAETIDLAVAVARCKGYRGVRRAKELLSLLDPRAESPMESYLRLLLVDAGVPRPEVNANVYDDCGEFLGRADLLFREARVIVEYDGDHHRTDRHQFAHDVRRGSRLAAAGYLVLRFTADDVLRRPHFVIATVRAALASRV